MESRRSDITRGVKQGDPINSLLCITVMESCFRTLKKKWQTLNCRRAGQWFGIVIDNIDDPLFNLRFADDVLLVAQNKNDAAKMIAHLAEEALKYGLKLHLGKTRILHNTTDAKAQSSAKDCVTKSSS